MAESKDPTPYNINTDPDADAKINFLAGYVNDPKNKVNYTTGTETAKGGKRKSRRNRKSRQNKKRSRQNQRKFRQSRRH